MVREVRDATRYIVYPHRWYTAQPNFVGDHIVTDTVGFRINPHEATNKINVGFFGGSTMFSASTTQTATIPGALSSLNSASNRSYLNFGMGGYSSSTELVAFIEAARIYKLSEVVFYDGVNEVARGLEKVQDFKLNRSQLYAKFGYPLKSAYNFSLESDEPLYSFRYDSSTLYIFKRLQEFRALNSTEAIDLNAIADSIVDLYYANVADISGLAKSKGIKAWFIWQPHIFNTSKKLTDAEKVYLNDKSLLGPLSIIVDKKVFSDPRGQKFGVIDLRSALDKVETTVFLDWCHLNIAGNRAIAKAIATAIPALGS